MLEIFENRDYEGSSHFFFGLGNGNTLAFFDFPGLDLGPYAEVLGGCTTSPSPWSRRGGSIRAKLDDAGVDYLLESEVSIYFTDPDGARIELIADPLGEMYGTQLLDQEK